ncbi:MAG: ABC transporter substrate-binding protein [Anaerolineae bacterium]|jgi:peptide/nickel transport system substrate-binding protein
MINSKKLAILVVLVMIAPLVLTACGGEAEPEVQIQTVVETVVVEGEAVEVEVTRVVEETVVETVVEEVEVTAVPEPVDRTGAWLDTVVFVEEPDSDAAVTRLEVGDIDVYAYSITEPPIAERILASDALDYSIAYGSFNELTFNPVLELNDGTLNPFGNPKVREAMNWLIDRNYICEEIVGGLAVPRYVDVQLASADYGDLADVIKATELIYSYNPEKAAEQITAEMEAMGAEMVDGKWTYNGEPVVITALIRVEDERLEIGDYVSNQLEDLGFEVFRDYKTSAEASTCWISSDPADGCFSFYTGGWVSTVISRDEASNFGDYYTPRGWGIPLWQAYNPSPEFDAVVEKLYTSDFTTVEERRELMAEVIPLSMEDSVRIWLKDDTGYAAWVKEASISSDLSGSVYGSALWPYTARWDDRIGGSMTIAEPSIMTQAWNPVAGSNWVYDMMPARGTYETATYNDPFTGLNLPNRVERAEVTMKEGLPVGVTLDWVSLDFAPEIEVPADAWADWDAENQTWITAGEKFTETQYVNRKVVTYYPEDMFDTVTWHDGSPLSIGDFVLYMIMQFDRAKEASPYYDEGAVPGFNSFISTHKGVRIVSEDPLVIETYDDYWLIDAEEMVDTWWPAWNYGPGAWHAIVPGMRADANLEAAWSDDKAVANEIEQLSYIAGPTLEIMAGELVSATEEAFIPYAPTLGEYISADEAAARYANLQEWYRRRGHFWVGTGPFYLERAFPVEGTLILQRFDAYPDASDKWAGFDEPPLPVIEIDGPDRVSIGEEAVYDIFATFKDEPYPAADMKMVKFMVFDATGALAYTGEAEAAEDGYWQATLGADVTGALEAGANQLLFVAVSNRAVIPVSETFDFVTQ